jgi:hypothetical protein
MLIRVTCEAATTIPLEEFEAFQGELKWLEEKQYEKLKASILKDGFHDPIHVWRKKGEKKPRKMLDGHQRINTIGRMVKVEGHRLEGDKGLPVVWVEAQSEKAAKRIVLEKASQYGKLDEDSLYKFSFDAGIEMEEIKEVADLPQINMGKFFKGWGDKEWTPEEKKAKPEVPFSEFIGEMNNYVVLLFDNNVDWLNAISHFGLETVAATRGNGDVWSIGIGRVINGAAYLTKAQKKK